MSWGFVPGGTVLVAGYLAALTAHGMRAAKRSGEFDGVHPNAKMELDALIAGYARAGEQWQTEREQAIRHEQPAAAEPASPPQLMTSKAAAALLGITDRQARNLAASGLGVKIGRRWWLDRAAVLAEKERRAAGPHPKGRRAAR